MTKVSNYHLVKFILESERGDTDSHQWMKRIARIFNDRIPACLLNGLIKKDSDPTIVQLCEKYHMSNVVSSLNASDRQQKQIKKHDEWLRRCEENNAMNKKEAEEKRKAQKKILHMKQTKDFEGYIDKIRPTWEKIHDDMVQKRKDEIAII